MGSFNVEPNLMLCGSRRENFILFKTTFYFFHGEVTFLDQEFAEGTEIALQNQKFAEDLLVF